MQIESTRKQNKQKPIERKNRSLWLSSIATIIAIIALLLGGNSYLTAINAEKISKNCAANLKPGPAGPAGIAGAKGASAYSLWLSVGNKGTLKDFLNSLIGKKGKDGYRGSTGLNGADGKDGVTGPSGTDGASAYQLWLDAGNTGTPEDFLTSLIGASGIDGDPGDPGTPGVAGAAGLSAYELWVAQGNSGTETDFLNSLVGLPGQDGANGTDGTNGTDGVDGKPGVDGKSAYQIWLEAGNTGTEIDFLASLQGPTGPQGPQGEAGTCTPGSGLGYWGAFFDTTTQTNDSGVNLMRFNTADPENLGVSISNNSRIVLAQPGTYNIAFSAQVTRLSGGNSADIDIWLKKNGTDVPDSDTAITLQSNASKEVAAWNFFVTTTNTNEYFELAWSSIEPSMELLYRPSNSTPAIPSIILTVNQVN